MGGFTAVDPDVLDEVAAYGPEPETETARAERLARAFEHGATLRLDAPPIEGATGEPDEPAEPGKRRRRRASGDTSSPRRRTVAGGQIGELFVAGFSILIGFTVGDWAAPTPVEAKAIADPLGNILARRIDLASKLGRDTDDVVTLAIAIMAWMSRVGPTAAGRARAAYAERAQRRTATRVDGPPQPLDDRGTGRVAPGRDDNTSSPFGATRSPLDAVAASSSRGLDYLDRNIGGGQGPTPAMAD